MLACRSTTAMLSAAEGSASIVSRAYRAAPVLGEGSSRGSSKVRRSGRRKVNEEDLQDAGVDLVGPPDPLSNIRPMIYAENGVAGKRHQGASSSSEADQKPHPYSVNEFNQQGVNRRAGYQGKGYGISHIFREYVGRVSDRVEEAEMKLRLSKMTTDATTQRFWRDNNARFTRDLHSWQKQHGAEEQDPADNPSDPRSLARRDEDRQLIAGLSSESDFYATWLRANAKRNRAYNILVWRQAFEQVRQGARVSILRAWLALLSRKS